MKTIEFNYKVTRVVGGVSNMSPKRVYYLLRNGMGKFQISSFANNDPDNYYNNFSGDSFCVIFENVRRNWAIVMSPIYVSK